MVQRLATEMYARGLSTRDIEDAFTDEQGRCLLSRSKVSEVTEVLWEQYQAFQERDLSDFPLLCLFLDGLYEPLRTHGITREAVLCAWGITLDGRKVLISLGLGSKESGEAWLEFVRDLDRRGLPAPLFVTTDGAGGLIQTIDQMWPKSLRGRCWVHRMRNFAAKVPDARWHEIKPYLVMIRDAPDLQAGQSAVREFLEKFSKEFPGLCKCLTEDLEALLATPPASLATPEVRPHHQPDRTQLCRGTPPNQNIAAILLRKELPEARLCCSHPCRCQVAEYQHHVHRTAPAPAAL